MEDATVSRCFTVSWIANAFCFAISTATALVSYLLAPNALRWEFICDFLNPKAGEIIIAKVCAFGLSLTSTGFFCYYVARTIANVVSPNAGTDRRSLFIAGMSVITFSVFSVFVGGKFVDICSLAGDISVCILSFILPPVFLLWEYGFQRVGWAVAAIFVLIIGLPLGVATIYLKTKWMLDDWNPIAED
jgi:hypothetical protein